MESHRTGDLTEAIVIAELKRRNIPIATPIGDNERYDLLIGVSDSGFLRVQIKTGRIVDGTVAFDGVSQHTNMTERRYDDYAGEIDYFVVWNDDLESLYLIPESEVNTTMRLRFSPPQSDHPSINWADDYEFDSRFTSEFDLKIDREDSLPPNRRGDATEAQVISELLRREIPIAIPPTDNDRYDLISRTPGGRYLRMQIKTGWIENDCVTFQTASIHSNGAGIVRKPYEGDADYFLVYLPPLEELYLIAEDSFNTNITLRLEEPEHPQWNTKLAEDYEFDRNWPPEGHKDPTPSRRDPQNPDNASAILDAIQAIAEQVATPMETAEWDYLATAEDGYHYRLAARTAPFKDGRVFFQPGRPNDGGIDAYLVLCRALETVYLITPDDFDTSISLWVKEPTTVRTDTKWATDFELETAWPPAPGRRYSRQSPIGLGTRAFESIGADVAHPSRTDAPYDLLVTTPSGDHLRVAIEAGWEWNGRIRLKPDRREDIDWYLLVCRERDTAYLIAGDEFDRSISLRVEPPEQDCGTSNWASEYVLETRWPP